MMIKITKYKLRGQSMIEVVIGLGVVVLLAISLVTTSLITQRTSRSARNNSQATKLAQETLEQIRIYRDHKGFNALSEGSCYILNATDADPLNWSLNSAAPPCPVGEAITLNSTLFNRYLIIEPDNSNANKKIITVSITWEDSAGKQNVTDQTILTKWDYI